VQVKHLQRGLKNGCNERDHLGPAYPSGAAWRAFVEKLSYGGNDLSGRELLAQKNAFRHALGCPFICGRLYKSSEFPD
jgi:hypothetical protein